MKTKLIHDIQPDNMWGLGSFTAMLNFMTTGLVYTKKIPVNYVDTGEYEIEVNVLHECDWRDYPEVCNDCFEHHVELAQQMDEDRYRDE